jgi:hypothetical protein
MYINIPRNYTLKYLLSFLILTQFGISQTYRWGYKFEIKGDPIAYDAGTYFPKAEIRVYKGKELRHYKGGLYIGKVPKDFKEPYISLWGLVKPFEPKFIRFRVDTTQWVKITKDSLF